MKHPQYESRYRLTWGSDKQVTLYDSQNKQKAGVVFTSPDKLEKYLRENSSEIRDVQIDTCDIINHVPYFFSGCR